LHYICLAAAFVVTTAAVASAETLLEAARRDDRDRVAALLKARPDVNARAADGATPLHWAAHHDDVALARMLLQAGARAGSADDTGATPLFLACMNRSGAMVGLLLDAGADANAALVNGETALMTCSQTGEITAVKALLAHGADVNRKEPQHGQTALMWAAAGRHADVVSALLAAHADVNARSRTYTQTVTSEVTQRRGREELNYTVPRGGSRPLLFVARSGDAESARVLLDAGANVNEALPNGMTALVEAAHSGNQDVGILLLERGADPNAADVGYTALHAAVLRSGTRLVGALLAHGANPNLRMTKGTPVRRNSEDFELPATLIGATPYFLAAKFLEPDIMRALASAGADVRLSMKSGETPLMAAAGMGASPQTDRRGLSVLDGGRIEDERRVAESVSLALANGADVNAANQAGDTAVHAAALLGYDSVLKQLAGAGAKVDAKNGRGLTALDQIAGKSGVSLRSPDRANLGPRQSTVELLRALGGGSQ
jgi:serine/threonine-protein phosphatase 6 regulatory ankyrin repeat subunit B